jgi:hypothetical protein
VQRQKYEYAGLPRLAVCICSKVKQGPRGRIKEGVDGVRVVSAVGVSHAMGVSRAKQLLIAVSDQVVQLSTLLVRSWQYLRGKFGGEGGGAALPGGVGRRTAT